MSLACGGRGPCCHVGYPHRHCEHCDVVVPVQPAPHYHWGNGYPYYGIWNQAYQQNLLGGVYSQLQAFNQSLPTDQVIHVEVDHAGE